MVHSALSDRRLVIVSNRLPFNVSFEDGKMTFNESAGGLVTGLASFMQSRRRAPALNVDHLWVGWPGCTVDVSLRDQLIHEALASFQSFPVFLTDEQMEKFYLGFCNATIWPLFHYFPTFTEYQSGYWEQYKEINQVFCEALSDVIRPNDVLWIHDYHLMLLPRLVKIRMPRVSVGFFLHIPFPSFEVFRLLPGEWRREILEGLLGADLIGFHTYEYTHHFLQCVLRILGYEHQMAQILTADHVVKVDTFPMGIDYEKFSNAPAEPDTERETQALRSTLAEFKVVLSVDRLDYSKGILNRLEGYDLFLESNPQFQGKVVLLMIVVPSRIGVLQYDRMKRQVEERVGKINGRFGRVGWTPVVYQYRHVPFSSLVAFYSVSDVCLVTPLRDGMNLVAKEYVATRTDGTGMLILSEMAGSVKELPEAIIINPNNRREIAVALKEALETPLEEQKRRNQIMQRRLKRYHVSRWANDFLNNLGGLREVQDHIEATLLSPKARREVIDRYKKSRRRGLFLDYDGTLTPLVRSPAMAKPDDMRLGLLRSLASDPANDIVITSGRDRHSLQEWFGDLRVGLVAEHGAWLKRAGESWQLFKPFSVAWKRQLLPILEIYADRLPGAFVEEKENSTAWHYRLADPEQAGFLAAELTDHLLNLISKTDLQVIQGSKVVEVTHAGVDKGSAALKWIIENEYDFVLALGDDLTDEDLFRVLPEWAVSIRVGIAGTHARHNLRNNADVIDLLQSLALPSSVSLKATHRPS
ncbi:MAG: bifunctional alpha,alpha-trehalose-phosphate synthase (UDP-forming)/trehalose-phosphatase [Deltaproteobacteria bacterium]|nr:bifunctional alpha,alpha-trehalose-phosphate synthase (UDP-forming)/trehalose-phosphatase [Deltaproteobacteria bacterium]